MRPGDLDNLNNIIQLLLHSKEISRTDSQAYISTVRRVIYELYPEEFSDGTTPSELDEIDEICYEIADGVIKFED